MNMFHVAVRTRPTRASQDLRLSLLGCSRISLKPLQPSRKVHTLVFPEPQAKDCWRQPEVATAQHTEDTLKANPSQLPGLQLDGTLHLPLVLEVLVAREA